MEGDQIYEVAQMTAEDAIEIIEHYGFMMGGAESQGYVYIRHYEEYDRAVRAIKAAFADRDTLRRLSGR